MGNQKEGLTFNEGENCEDEDRGDRSWENREREITEIYMNMKCLNSNYRHQLAPWV